MFLCIIVFCCSLGIGLTASASASAPLTITQIVTLPANSKQVTIGQVRKTNTGTGNNYSTIIASNPSSGLNSMTVRIWRIKASNGANTAIVTKTIIPKGAEQKLVYASGISYSKNDGMKFVGWQSASSSKTVKTTIYGN